MLSLQALGPSNSLIPLRRVDWRRQDYARHADGKGQKDTDRCLRSQEQRADKWSVRDRHGDRNGVRKEMGRE